MEMEEEVRLLRWLEGRGLRLENRAAGRKLREGRDGPGRQVSRGKGDGIGQDGVKEREREGGWEQDLAAGGEVEAGVGMEPELLMAGGAGA